MRINAGARALLKSTILDDLYGKAEKKISARKKDIANQSYMYYIAPLQDAIAKLPNDMVSHCREFVINVIDTNNSVTADPSTLRWSVNFGTLKPAPLDAQGYIRAPAPQIIDPRLQAIASVLISDIYELEKEKAAMVDFLTITLNKYSGIKQLMTVWPTALHKYLPKPPAPKPKDPTTPKSKATDDKINAPDSLNTRLTTNLLEGF